MSTSPQTRELVRAFHVARTAGDRAAAVELLAPSFNFQSPMMRFDDPDIYVENHIRFQQLVTGFQMISELYGDDEATLVYDLHTATPAGVQRTAEHFKVAGGKISSILLIFDATLWWPILTAANET